MWDGLIRPTTVLGGNADSSQGTGTRENQQADFEELLGAFLA